MHKLINRTEQNLFHKLVYRLKNIIYIHYITRDSKKERRQFLEKEDFFIYFFLAFDFCRFFSTPPQRPMTSDFEGFSIPDFIHNIYFSYLNS